MDLDRGWILSVGKILHRELDVFKALAGIGQFLGVSSHYSDEDGEELVKVSGVVSGVLAFVDLALLDFVLVDLVLLQRFVEVLGDLPMIVCN